MLKRLATTRTTPQGHLRVKGSRVEISPARPCLTLSEAHWPRPRSERVNGISHTISHGPCQSDCAVPAHA